MTDLKKAELILDRLVREFPMSSLKLKQVFALEEAKEFLTKLRAPENVSPTEIASQS